MEMTEEIFDKVNDKCHINIQKNIYKISSLNPKPIEEKSLNNKMLIVALIVSIQLNFYFQWSCGRYQQCRYKNFKMHKQRLRSGSGNKGVGVGWGNNTVTRWEQNDAHSNVFLSCKHDNTLLTHEHNAYEKKDQITFM